MSAKNSDVIRPFDHNWRFGEDERLIAKEFKKRVKEWYHPATWEEGEGT